MGITVFEPAPTPDDEPCRQREVEQSGALALRGDTALQSLVEDVRETLQASAAAVSIVYKEWHYVLAGSGLAAGAYSRRTSLCGHAIVTPGELFLVCDLAADDRFAGHPTMSEREPLRFYAGAPLRASAGPALGTLCVFDRSRRRDLSAGDRAYLHRQAGMVVARLDRASLR